jgi:sugar phosphate isomerase/epimerase
MYKCIIISIFAFFFLECKNQSGTKESMAMTNQDTTLLKISLAEWSYHTALQSGKMNHLDFATKAGELGFAGVEYVNQFFKDKAQDTAYLNKMTEKANAAGVKQLLIMIDGEGYLGDIDAKKRNDAVTNHYKWVDAAAYLGCHSIRVNAHGEGTAEEVAKAAKEGLSQLADYAATKNINVIVENHGGYSSNGEWLTGVIAGINKPNSGTLPDFGNFCLRREKADMWQSPCVEEYDRYKGVAEMMPYAKAVSAKSFDFGEMGFETTLDYPRLIEIVLSSGYHGYIGVEYEGKNLGEEEGVKATKLLIEKCIADYSAKSK